jgi:Putative Actinobacterial Holin-X, holin superfamily III
MSIEPDATGTPSQDLRERTYDVRASQPDSSLGELVGEVTRDLQTLFRQEVALAKTEIREEATKSAKAAGLLGGAGFAGYMVVILITLAAVFGLGAVIPLGWAALAVGAVWALIGIVLYSTGRSRMRAVSVKPERTIETLKEDAQWARHPTR